VIYGIYSHSIPSSVDGVVQQKALEMGKKLTMCICEKWPETETRFLINLTGSTSRVTWVTRYKSRTEAEQFEKKIWEDSGVKAIMAEWSAAEKKAGSPFLTHSTTEYMADVE
jgi:hypothetical protein